MTEVKLWPLGDIDNEEGMKTLRIPQTAKQLDQFSVQPQLFADPGTTFDNDHVCIYVQLPDNSTLPSASSSYITSDPFANRDDIQTVLNELGFLANEISVTHDRRHVGYVVTAERREAYCVKYLYPERCGEIDVLEYLLRFDSPQNHAPRVFISRNLAEGALLLTRELGQPVKDYKNLSRDLLPVVRQLFEAIAFLHSVGVVHMDLKPSHIIVDESGRLWIVDYDLSKILKDGEETVNGFRGTEGRTAPEVGMYPYNAFLADVWAVGKVVQDLCDLFPIHEDRDYLMKLCEKLMNADPKNRPSMSDAFDEIDGYMKTHKGDTLP